MLIPDNEHLRAIRKTSQAIPSSAAGANRGVCGYWRRRVWGPRAVWVAAVALILVIGAGLLRIHPGTGRSGKAIESPDHGVRNGAPSAPLTIRSANAWLAQAPTVKAGIDLLAFSSQNTPFKNGKQSAIAVLSKEKIKL